MNPAIIVHGGAGVVDASRLPLCQRGCQEAASKGWAALEGGGSALDAVEAAVRALEDDAEFNAGYGAVLDRDGVVEVDAAIMDGALGAGAVGAVPWLRHPVTLARRILDDGRHILLVSGGALEFARGCGIAAELPGAMVTARARDRWERERSGRTPPSATGDTVGALALDRAGRLAAASSTGGISFKHPGRVGDSPIIGAGLYALDGIGAATATGHGESILRVVMCRFAVDEMERGAGAAEAAASAVAELSRRTAALPDRGTVGVITLDAQGRIGHSRSSEVMPWAAVCAGQTSSDV